MRRFVSVNIFIIIIFMQKIMACYCFKFHADNLWSGNVQINIAWRVAVWALLLFCVQKILSYLQHLYLSNIHCRELLSGQLFFRLSLLNIYLGLTQHKIEQIYIHLCHPVIKYFYVKFVQRRFSQFPGFYYMFPFEQLGL